jgi:hypothetical protein
LTNNRGKLRESEPRIQAVIEFGSNPVWGARPSSQK